MPDTRPAARDRFRPGTAPLRRMDKEWITLWSEQLDPRVSPSVSGAARVSSLIRAAAATGQGGLISDARLAYDHERAEPRRSG